MTNMFTIDNLSNVRPKTNGSVVSAIKRFQNVMKNSPGPTKRKKIVTAFDRLTRSEENNHDKKNEVLSTSDHGFSTENALESENQSKKNNEEQDQDQEADQEEHQEQDDENHDGYQAQDQDQDENQHPDGDGDGEGSQNDFQESGSRELFGDNPLFREISHIDTNNNTIKSLLETKVNETTSLIPLLSETIITSNSFPSYGSPNDPENNAEFRDIEMVQPYDANITINKTNGVFKQKWLIWMMVIITTVLCVVAVYLYFAL